MKVKVRVLLASVLVSTLVLPVTRAAAATGTVCKTESARVTISPTLPKVGSTKLVNATAYVKGTLAGCTNGVTGGTFTGAGKLGKANCATAGDSKTTSTEKITWNPASDGTSTLRLTTVIFYSGGTTTGTVSSGRFRGTSVAFTFTFTGSNPGSCVTTGLKTQRFKSTSAVHI